MKSFLVIGAGRFGTNLAVRLTELGNEVLLVDTSEEAIDKLSPLVTRAQIGDCMDKEVLEELGVRNFDACFVCISENFQSSMEVTSLLKEMGAPCVVSKSDRDIHAGLLKKIGADDVVYPERDMARRTAVRYSARGAFDYVELSEGYAIIEITPPPSWIGHDIRELDVRIRNHVNIVGIRENGRVNPVIGPDYCFTGRERIIIAGGEQDLMKLTKN